MLEVQLLGKSEIWLRGVDLDGAELPRLAQTVADALSLPRDKVFVTDVRDGVVVVDVLLPSVSLEQVVGREAQVLEELAALEGVSVRPDAAIHSEGVLGVIGAPSEEAPRILSEAKRMERNIREYAARRVAVVATGAELARGNVRDTNFEVAREILGAAGFEVSSGGVVEDDETQIAGLVARLAADGYGLVLTTGGVGAEDKDRMIEALERLDPELATAVLATYRRGAGRHVKSSVRIAVATLGWTTVVALPGPTHEVRLAMPVLVEQIASGTSPAVLAEALAAPLRASLPAHHAARNH